MQRNTSDFPPITKRIKDLIDEKFGGNVRQFAFSMGLGDSVKINRLFKRDKRNNEYPIPSTEIIMLICNTYDLSSDWILFGKEKGTKTVNNIDIKKNNIDGNSNIIGDNNAQTNDTELLSVVKAQQEQINKLLNIISNG